MIIFGLGNPGSEYSETRHNVGFMTVEKVAALKETSFRKRCFRPYRYCSLDEKNTLIEPLTYMNNSGEVIPFVLKDDDTLVVICDQMDLPQGKVRIKNNSGSAGHNGLKSILKYWDKDFLHIYIGIGRPKEGVDVPSYVLSSFTEEEKVLIDKATSVASSAIIEMIEGKPINEIIQRVNSYDSR